MKKMILASLLTNAVVLIPVCLGLLMDASWVIDVYGQASPARAMLLSVYGSILIYSMVLLFKPEPTVVGPLLLVQVLYKLTTPFTVGSFTNPVVITNIIIATLHLATLGLILREIQYTQRTNGSQR